MIVVDRIQAIQEGRYAMKTGYGAAENVYNKNFTLLTRLVTLFQPETDKFVMPVNENVREYYNVKVKGLQSAQGRKIAVIDFTPREELYIPAMEGTLYIDIDSYEILKLRGTIRNDNLELVALNKEKNHLIEIVAHDLRNPLTSSLAIAGNLKSNGGVKKGDESKMKILN